MRSLDDLLEEAKWGKLTNQELNYIVKRTEASTPDNEDENLYTLIHILGRAQATQYRKLIESFLYYPTDPMISKIALQSLCSYWGFHKDYLDEIKKFAKGEDWDFDEDIRIIAISQAGEFLRYVLKTDPLQIDVDLLQILTRIFENARENPVIQECVYSALARAAGQEWQDLLPDENKPNPLIMKKIYNLIEKNRI